jgi:hypothetical protein
VAAFDRRVANNSSASGNRGESVSRGWAPRPR